MKDITESRVVEEQKKEEEKKPVHHQWWFWAVLVALMALSLYSGSRSSSTNVEYATPIVETRQRSSDLTQADASPVEIDQVHEASHRFAAIKKLNPGLISRLYEEKRLLYVNDPVWKVTSSKRKAFTIRAIAEYLDWIHGTSSGMVDVRSFRNGQRLKVTW